MVPKHNMSLLNIQPKPTKTLKMIPFLTYSESLAFDRFRSQTVFEMAGVRSSGFWQNVVLPACYSEPAILHASMALSNASGWLKTPRSPTGVDAMQLNTINYYNKAIQHLRLHVSKSANSSSLRITLISCVVFIALELSSRRYEEAAMHLNEGRKLLQSCHDFNTSTNENQKVKSSTLMLKLTPQSIEDELIAIFVDLDLQSTYFGSQKPQLKLSAHKQTESVSPEGLFSLALPTDFYSIREANQSLVLLTNKCLQFVGQKLDPELHSLRNKLNNQQRHHLQTSLKIWRKTYDRFHSKANIVEKSGPAWQQQSALILLQHTWLSIVIPTSYFEIKETDYDVYIQQFMAIIEFASSVLPKEGLPWGHFSLEFGLVPPLSWTVLKCRHPRLRREALCLLHRAGREGLWEPRLPAQLGRECVLIEEGIEDLGSPPSPLNLPPSSLQEKEWSHLIPLKRRISICLMQFESSDYSTLRMTFKRKVWDSDGKHVGTEEIVLRRPYEGRVP
jgi:Fungal specific transcription factor domain